MKKFFSNKFSIGNRILSLILLLSISASIVYIANATAPDPGHNFTEVSGGATLGGVIYGSAADVFSQLAGNTTATKKFLTQTGNGSVSAAPAWSTLASSDVGLGSVENTALSTWAGTANVTTLGTIGTGTWNATNIADAKIASALTGKTYNALTLTAQTTGFTIAGGTTAKTLTVTGDATISGSPLADPMTTIGDIIIRNASNITARLAGSAGFLKSTGAAAPTWSTINLASSADVGTSILPVADGGTGLASLTSNNLVYGNGTGNASLLAPGATTGAILMNTAAGAPSWSLLSGLPSTAGALPVANGGTGLSAAVSDAVLVGDSTSGYTARTLPASCAGTTAKLLYDSTTNLFSCGTDQTSAGGTANQYNQSVAAQGAGFATDTYLTGSSIAIPANSLKIGTRYHLIFNVSKTAAGLATPVLSVRFGTAGSTADTARLTFTFLAGTAVADIGTFEIFATFRTVGSGTSAVIQGTGRVEHSLSTTGLQNLPTKVLTVTSGGFDSTVASSIIGVSVNGGASAAWTVQQVQAELQNLQ